MKKNKYFVLVFLLAFFSSCNSDVFEEHEIGDNLIDKSTEVILIDTFTINTSTVKLDSVVSSGTQNVVFDNFFVGQFNDPYLGEINSSFYGLVDLGEPFSLRMSDGINIPVKFDSLVFIGYLDENPLRFIGDSLLEQSLSIHQVIETFELPSNKSSYKTFDALNYKSESLGEATFMPQPVKNSHYDENDDKNPLAKRGGVRFRMKDQLGLDIIDLVNKSDEKVIFSSKWAEYFKGIVIKPGDENSAMLSFLTGNNRMKIRLYYSDTAYNEVGVVQFHDFPVNKNYLNFSNVKSNFESNNGIAQKIGSISGQKNELHSNETDDLSFIQGSLGIMTKIQIPYVDQLNILGLTGGLLNAELRLYPKEGSYDHKYLRLPDYENNKFVVYSTNETNKIENSLPDPSVNSTLTSSFHGNNENIGESYFSIDLTGYINDILLHGQEHEDALLLSFPKDALGNIMDRLVIDNGEKSDFKIKLRATYVVQK